MPLATGTLLGRYEILSPLGAGGMGEVYRARDTRLGRDVAVKVLPAALSGDAEKLRRFEQEACAASQLNHPNILTIHEVGREGETHYIATEFIDGATLRRHIARAQMKLGEALDAATQVASALAAAHAAGIVHRDVKPENVMLRRDGIAKVLDFGIAKLTERARPRRSADLEAVTTELIETDPGKVMGTARYMSPEQARGEAVDARTDIWALGVVLYEMLTDHAPFEGATTSHTIIAILEHDPPPLARFLRNAPEELERIVTKALAKDREQRYQTVKDLLIDLRRLKQHLEVEAEVERSVERRMSDGTTAATAAGSRPGTRGAASARAATDAARSEGEGRGRKTAAAVAAIAAAVAAFASYSWIASRRPATPAPFQRMKMTRITTSGKTGGAAISPDGRYVVYVTYDAGLRSLWVRQVATGSDVRIVAPADISYRGTTFSRDGQYVYYVLYSPADPNGTLYRVPVLGGAPRKLLAHVDSPVALSPDDARVAFLRRHQATGEEALMIANADGGGERNLATRKGADFFSQDGPSWSPDGKLIACGAGTSTGGLHTNLIAVPAEGGAERLITPQSWARGGRVAWLFDGTGLVLSAVEQSAGLFQQLWYVSYPEGSVSRITNDLNDYSNVSLSPTADSKTLLTVQTESDSNIWTTAPVATGATDSDAKRARQITSGVNRYDTSKGISWTPDGKLVAASLASGNQDIWAMDSDGANAKQLTSDALRDHSPSAAPDGRSIVFVSNRSGGTPHLWRMDSDGGNQTELTRGEDRNPDVSPDGRWVFYDSWSGDKLGLWKVSIGGGDAARLSDAVAERPAVSPDGKLVACTYFDEKATPPWRIALLAPDGGAPVKTFVLPPTAFIALGVRWAPDGQSLTYVDTQGGVSNLWAQPVSGGAPRQLTAFDSAQMFNFAWSRDGKQLACTRGASSDHIVLISDFR